MERSLSLRKDNELLLKVSGGRVKPEDIIFEKRKDALDKLGTVDYTFQDDYKNVSIFK